MKTRGIEVGGGMPLGRVQKLPDIVLDGWHCYEAQQSQRATRTQHLVGYRGYHKEGSVSSAIVTFDPTRRKAITESGRCYELGPNTDLNQDCGYVWGNFSGTNGAYDFVDVTDDLKTLMEQK